MDRPPAPCPHDDDRIRLPAIPPPRSGGTGKKESQARRHSRACPQSGRPSLTTSRDRHPHAVLIADTRANTTQSTFCTSSARVRTHCYEPEHDGLAESLGGEIQEEAPVGTERVST